MKKRIIAFVLAATMVAGMTGCGSKSSDTASTQGAAGAASTTDLNVMIETGVE